MDQANGNCRGTRGYVHGRSNGGASGVLLSGAARLHFKRSVLFWNLPSSGGRNTPVCVVDDR